MRRHRLWMVPMRTRERSPGATGGGGQGDKTLLQFPRRGPGVGAQHQIFWFGQTAEQDVGSPERHRQGLAGAGTQRCPSWGPPDGRSAPAAPGPGPGGAAVWRAPRPLGRSCSCWFSPELIYRLAWDVEPGGFDSSRNEYAGGADGHRRSELDRPRGNYHHRGRPSLRFRGFSGPMMIPRRKRTSRARMWMSSSPDGAGDLVIGLAAIARASSSRASPSRIRPSVTAQTSRWMRSVDSAPDTFGPVRWRSGLPQDHRCARPGRLPCGGPAAG